MKVFDAQQMKEWDQFTMAQQQITSLQLMERAAQKCTDWILNHYPDTTFQVIAGTGNNGGDGVAIARQLWEKGKKTTLLIAGEKEKGSPDFLENMGQLQEKKFEIRYLLSEPDFSNIQPGIITIDALFGYGLNRPVEGLTASLINYINQKNTTVISVDVPSGMYISTSSVGNTMVKATHTLTFQASKLCFLQAENAPFFGDVHVLPIGLSEEWEKSTDTRFEITDLQKASSHYKKRKRFSHKGTYGRALLIAGNEGKMGAAVMCATSCLRSGVGLLTCSLPQNDFSIIHNTIPEAMVMKRGEETGIEKWDVIGAGPGLGTEDNTSQFVHSLFAKTKHPMVLDADALNIISKNKEWLKEVPAQSVLTPHPKEFDRLFGESETDFDRMNQAVKAAAENNVIVVLKGSYTLVTDGKRNWYNSSGNNGMATGGSGDILTGLVTGLLAQKYEPFAAAVVAVFVHGLAADLCLDEQSYESMLPMDIVAHFGKAFKQLDKGEEKIIK